MKFQLTFKTPDVTDQIPFDMESGNAQYRSDKLEECLRLTEEFVTWGEVITIEFDTRAKTATVLRVL